MTKAEIKRKPIKEPNGEGKVDFVDTKKGIFHEGLSGKEQIIYQRRLSIRDIWGKR